MITKKIVWFFGPSCAGKTTIIERVVSSNLELYSKILALSSFRIIKKCEEGFVTSKSQREDLAVIIPERYDFLETDCLLIKGQTSDLDRIAQDLRRKLPNVKHEIVFLWVSPEELNRRRLETRSGDPWDGWSINTHKDELKIQVEKVDKLRGSDFPVFWIDNTGNLPKILTHDEVILRTEQFNKIG